MTDLVNSGQKIGEYKHEVKSISGTWVNLRSRRLAYSVGAEKGMFVCVDGKEQPKFDEVRDFRFSHDGAHYAYVAVLGAECLLIKDGVEVYRYGFIGFNSVRWCPGTDKLAFTVWKSAEKKYYIVYEGQEFGPLDAEQPQEGYNVPLLVFHPLTGEVAYAAKRNEKWAVEISGKRLQEHGGPVSEISFAGNDGAVAYRFRENGRFSYSIKGKLYGDYDLCHDLTLVNNGDRFIFKAQETENSKETAVYNGEILKMDGKVQSAAISSDGTRYAAAIRRGGKYVVLSSGHESSEYSNVFIPVFSHDGKRLAYVAVDEPSHGDEVPQDEESGYKHYVVLDGKPLRKYPSDINHHSLVFSPDGAHIAYHLSGDRQGVAIDDQGPYWCDGLWTDLAFSPDGKAVEYIASKGADFYFVGQKV